MAFEAQSRTPASRCVRFAAAVTDAYATLATGRPRYGLTRAGLSPAGTRQLLLTYVPSAQAARTMSNRASTRPDKAKKLRAEARPNLRTTPVPDSAPPPRGRAAVVMQSRKERRWRAAH
ncbi:MAG: hypothetical protein WA231_17580 [Methylocella sp.]